MVISVLQNLLLWYQVPSENWSSSVRTGEKGVRLEKVSSSHSLREENICPNTSGNGSVKQHHPISRKGISESGFDSRWV